MKSSSKDKDSFFRFWVDLSDGGFIYTCGRVIKIYQRGKLQEWVVFLHFLHRKWKMISKTECGNEALYKTPIEISTNGGLKS